MSASPASSRRQPLPSGGAVGVAAERPEQERGDLVAGGEQARRQVHGRGARGDEHGAERARARRGGAAARRRAGGGRVSGGAASPARRAASIPSASAPRMRSGSPRSFSSARRSLRGAGGRSPRACGRARSRPRACRAAPPRARATPRATGSTARSRGVEAAAALHPAPRRVGVGHQAGVGAVAAGVLLGDPLGAAERLGAPRQLVGELQEVGDVGGAVLELRLRERPAAPVRVALALVERHAEHPLEQRRQPLAGAEARRSPRRSGRRAGSGGACRRPARGA